MRTLALAVCFSIGAAFTAAPKPVQRPAKVSKQTVKKSATKSSKKRPVKASSKTTRKRSSRATRPPRQAHPTPERYREIQQALIVQGFLSGEPTSKWDEATVEAFKAYEESQGLKVDGKIDAKALIGLGLGPKREDSQPDTPKLETPQPDAPKPDAAP